MILGSNTVLKAPSSLIEVTPSGKTLGAEVRNVDVRSFDDWQFAAIMRALLRHQVVLVCGQILSDPELIAFCRRFGGVGCSLQDGDHRLSGELHEIHIESHVTANAEFGTSATPLAFAGRPSPLASVLYTPDTVSFGATTAFCSLYAIYDALPPRLRGRIAHLKISHDSANDDGFARRRAGANRPVSSRDTVMPLVSTHPDTGRSMLHLGQRPHARLLGVPDEESNDLLDELWQFTKRSEFAWQLTPRPNDLLIWDNRCALRRQRQFAPASICAIRENSERAR